MAAIISNNAMATGENTVTSKSYVDAQDALKQDKITAKTTGNVVTYNGTSNGQTQFDEVGIYNGGSQYNSSTDSGKLITAGTVANMATAIESITIPDNKLTCYNQNDGCTLWQISEGTVALTDAGTLRPLTAPACKAYGERVSSVSECCSGVFQDGTSQCGCVKKSDCPSGAISCSSSGISITYTCLMPTVQG